MTATNSDIAKSTLRTWYRNGSVIFFPCYRNQRIAIYLLQREHMNGILEQAGKHHLEFADRETGAAAAKILKKQWPMNTSEASMMDHAIGDMINAGGREPNEFDAARVKSNKLEVIALITDMALQFQIDPLKKRLRVEQAAELIQWLTCPIIGKRDPHIEEGIKTALLACINFTNEEIEGITQAFNKANC